MTFVGKILVIVIMAFALLFLGISTVVFSTHTNWKEATSKERTKVQDLTKKVADAKDEVARAEKDLAAAKTAAEGEKKALNDRITQLNTDIENARSQATEAKDQLGKTQDNMKIALDEANARKQETDTLRAQKGAVEKQGNEYKLRQTELNDKIRELERMLETAKKNEADLRDRTARYSSLLRKHGLSDDISQVKGLESPPPVEGEVVRVDKQNKTLEVSIGSDDGLVPGHELLVFRTKPRPEFLGRVRVRATDPDQAVAEVIGRTIQGKKIQEGDIVSSTLRPR